MKRAAAFFFLSLLLLNIAGAYVYFFVRLQQIKTQMRAELKYKPVEELEVLELTQNAFQQALVGEHEIEVGGKMYDIARVERKGGRVIVYALHDEAEDNLLSLLDAILKNATKDKKPLPSTIGGLPTLLFLPADFQHGQIESQVVQHRTGYRFVLRCALLSIEGPPPKNQTRFA
ncbi:MAG: hypothetical protein ACOYXA_00555 [Bacteroidota bacterium]